MYVIVNQGAAFKGAFGAPILIDLVKQRKPDLILGVSSGAWNSIAVAAGKQELLKELWMNIDDTNVLDGITGLLKTAIFSRAGLLDLMPMRQKLELSINLADLEIPFGAGVVVRETKRYKTCLTRDMTTNKELYDAVHGSAAIAFVMKPVKTIVNGIVETLSDGGHRHTIPIIPQEFEDKVTEVDVILCNPIDTETLPTRDVTGLSASLRWIFDTQAVASQFADLLRYKILALKGVKVRVFAPPCDLGGMFQTDRKTIHWRWELGEKEVNQMHSVIL